MIKPGVCGICGTAVVQPDKISIGWYNGHLFERKLKPNQTKETYLALVRVRCMMHKESGDPRVYDVKGNIISYRDLEFDKLEVWADYE